MGASEQRAAAALRRRAAELAGERGGDQAYRAMRSAVPYAEAQRRPGVPAARAQLRAKMDKLNGRDFVHTEGFFTRYGMAYPMWDMHGEYEEVVTRGAGRRTLAAKPQVAFLVNHTGKSMATTEGGTLVLDERDEGGWHDAWLNPARTDVKDLQIAIEDGDIKEMSFAFMIPDGGGLWSEDFMTFEIRAYDIDRGDVSAVNFGANPHTDIAARAAEVLNGLDHLPAGALAEASARLARRGAPVRERVGVAEYRMRPAPEGASRQEVRLHSRIERTAARFVAEAAARGLTVADLTTAKLPWYEIRDADGASSDDPIDAGSDQIDDPGSDTATIFVFDEIGGSFGVSAKKFAADLEAIAAPNIKLRINSPGGSVRDGLAIHSALLHKGESARITAYVDGWACSAASFLAMGAHEVVMMPGSQLMIHNASATADVDEDEAESLATFLRRQSENIADLYVRKAGGTRDEWRALMKAETWMFDAEAVELGLADRVYDDPEPPTGATDDMQQRMARQFDLTRYGYRYAGRVAAPAPRAVRLAASERAINVPAYRPDVRRSSETPLKGRSIALVEAYLDIDELEG